MQKAHKRYQVLLLPGFSNLVLGAVTASVMASNSILGEEMYDFSFVALEAGEVIAEAGNPVVVSAIDEETDPFCLVICGGSPVSYQQDPLLLAWLKTNAYRYQHISGMATGSLVMADAGLLNNHKAALHWWDEAYLWEHYPNVRHSSDSFSVDRTRSTCRGGSSGMDMMAFLLAQEHGADFGESLAQHFIRARVGGTPKTHRVLLTPQQQNEQPRLTEAVQLMEANIEEPLSTDDIARHVGVSRRQLERLFKKHLSNVPSKYYQTIRLEAARSMLYQTELSVIEIAMQCGYSSGAHLSTSYRNYFGMTPSEERKRSMLRG
jgi:transcriptional regulator GlxA family with amidase domain